MTDEATAQGPSGDRANPSSPAREAASEAAPGKESAEGLRVEGRPTPGSAPDSRTGAGPAGDAARDAGDRSLHDHVLGIQDDVSKLLERFDEKLLHDEARTHEIKRLNAELAKHQPDAKWNTARPFVDRMIRHLDEIQRFVQRYGGRGDATAKDFAGALEWLHEDIELALEEHDITAYRPQAGKDPFDGRRHSVVGNPIPTRDPCLARIIERCVRPGFERDGKVVARAAVRIYRHDGKEEPQ